MEIWEQCYLHLTYKFLHPSHRMANLGLMTLDEFRRLVTHNQYSDEDILISIPKLLADGHIDVWWKHGDELFPELAMGDPLLGTMGSIGRGEVCSRNGQKIGPSDVKLVVSLSNLVLLRIPEKDEPIGWLEKFKRRLRE